MFQIVIEHDGRRFPVRMIPDGAVDIPIDEAKDVNRVRWPLGASRWGSVKLFAHSVDVTAIFEALGKGGSTTPVTVRFGDVTLYPMWLRPPVPYLLSDGSGVVYVVELVDDRYFWRNIDEPGQGYNATLDDKEKLFDATENTGPAAWTFGGAISDLVEALTTWTNPGAFDLTDSLGNFSQTVGLRDFLVQHTSAAVALDRLLAMVGYVLAAKPIAGDDGKRYVVTAIEDGEDVVRDFVSLHSTRLIGGGLIASLRGPAGITGPGRFVFGVPSDLKTDVPSRVRVVFPIAQKGGDGYSFDETVSDETGWNAKRWYSVTSTAGRPATSGNSGAEVVVFDPQWAIYDGTSLENGAELNIRAGFVAQVYYARFRAGIGKMWLAGTIVPTTWWAGCQEVEWRWTARGPVTMIAGDFEWSGFGWNPAAAPALQAVDVVGIGRVRAMPRPWGGVLLDAPSEQTEKFEGLVEGTPSAVTDGVKWTYPIVEAEYNGSSVLVKKTGGRSVTAYNVFEENSTSAYENTDCTGVSTTPPVGFLHRRPHPDGAKVGWVWKTRRSDGTVIWRFYAQNPVCPDCEAPA